MFDLEDLARWDTALKRLADAPAETVRRLCRELAPGPAPEAGRCPAGHAPRREDRAA